MPAAARVVALAVCCAAMVAWSGAAGGPVAALVAGARRARAPGPRPRALRPGVRLAATARTCAGARSWGRRCAAPARRRPTSTCPPGACRSPTRPTSRSRTRPAYPRADIDALVAFVGSFGGPGIPRVDPARGSARRRAWRSSPSTAPAATRSSGAGGSSPAPPSPPSTRPTADAARRGRPRRALPDAEVLGAAQLDQATLDSIARYVQSDPPPGRPRRLGHRQPRPDPGGDGRVAPGHGRCCSASRASSGSRRHGADEPPGAPSAARARDPRAPSCARRAALLVAGRPGRAAPFAVLIVVHPQTQLLGATLGARAGLPGGRADPRRQARRRPRGRRRGPPVARTPRGREDDEALAAELRRGGDGITRRRALGAAAAVAGAGLAGALVVPVTALGPGLGDAPDADAVAARAPAGDDRRRAAARRRDRGRQLLTRRCPRAPTSASSARPWSSCASTRAR